jgi:hypothetical protein
MKLFACKNPVFPLLITLFCMTASCLKIPITTTLDVNFAQEVTASNPMKKDEVWTNTRSIDLKREIEKRGISIKSLKRATVVAVYNEINQVRCEQVENVSATVNGLSFKDAVFGYDTNKCATQEILTGAVDITTDIKNGTPATMRYTMKAKETFTQAHGFTTVVALEVEYENKN